MTIFKLKQLKNLDFYVDFSNIVMSSAIPAKKFYIGVL